MQKCGNDDFFSCLGVLIFIFLVSRFPKKLSFDFLISRFRISRFLISRCLISRFLISKFDFLICYKNIYIISRSRICIKKESIVLENKEMKKKPGNLGNENSGNQIWIRKSAEQRLFWLDSATLAVSVGPGSGVLGAGATTTSVAFTAALARMQRSCKSRKISTLWFSLCRSFREMPRIGSVSAKSTRSKRSSMAITVSVKVYDSGIISRSGPPWPLIRILHTDWLKVSVSSQKWTSWQEKMEHVGHASWHWHLICPKLVIYFVLENHWIWKLEMKSGNSTMESDDLKMESGNLKWKVKLKNAKWKLENGKWKLKNGKWKLENGK